MAINIRIISYLKWIVNADNQFAIILTIWQCVMWQYYLVLLLQYWFYYLLFLYYLNRLCWLWNICRSWNNWDDWWSWGWRWRRHILLTLRRSFRVGRIVEFDFNPNVRYSKISYSLINAINSKYHFWSTVIEIRSDNFDIWEKSFSKLSTFLSQFIMNFILSYFFYLTTINLNNKCRLIIPLGVSKIKVEYQTSFLMLLLNTYFYWINYLFMNIRRLWM